MKDEQKGKISMDINNVRKILISEYTDLCWVLNNSAIENQNISINPKVIKPHMDMLRLCIGILAATYIEGRKDFQSVGDNELPIFKTPNE